MKKIILFFIVGMMIMACHKRFPDKDTVQAPLQYEDYLVDKRDNHRYGIVQIGDLQWMAENLKYDSPKSICYKKKSKYCHEQGKLYPYDELDMICPKGWRVPKLMDWQHLKKEFGQDSIRALLHTRNWTNTNEHTNASGLSLEGAGYQIERKLFFGKGAATSLWLNQKNKYDEYYHVHLYGGKGIFFNKNKYQTNEVLHAHPIEDLANRRFSVRCVCEVETE